MTTTTTPAQPTATQPLPIAPAGEPKGDGRTAATDFLQIESIVLNLDASLRVHARAHFFSWTQGLLQSLIRHELLVCTLCHGKPPAFRADGFSMTTPDPAMFSDMFLRDTAVAPALLKAWEERRYQPVVMDTAGSPLGNGAFAREIERLGATQLLVHGVHDADGRAVTLFTFACRSGSVGPRQAYLAQLLAPSLHSAWVRTQLAQRTQSGADNKASGQSVLTVREQEILKWIYLGKSNFEIGAILMLVGFYPTVSPLSRRGQGQARTPTSGIIFCCSCRYSRLASQTP